MLLEASKSISLHHVAMPVGPATRCNKIGHFPAILDFWKQRDHCRSLQGSPKRLQQCDQSSSHDGMFPYHILKQISHEMPIIMLQTV